VNAATPYVRCQLCFFYLGNQRIGARRPRRTEIFLLNGVKTHDTLHESDLSREKVLGFS
jgi:hypothetical protein